MEIVAHLLLLTPRSVWNRGGRCRAKDQLWAMVPSVLNLGQALSGFCRAAPVQCACCASLAVRCPVWERGTAPCPSSPWAVLATWYPRLQDSQGDLAAPVGLGAPMFQNEGSTVWNYVEKAVLYIWSRTAISTPCLWRDNEGKRHKMHLCLLKVIHWSRTQAISDQGKVPEYFVYRTKREKAHFLTVSIKFYRPIFLLLLTPLSSLTRISLCKFSLLPDVICP